MLPIWPLRLPRFVSGRVPACFPLTRSETPSLRLSRLGILREEESRRSSGPAEGREGAVRDPADAARARGGGYYKQAHEEIGSTEEREGRGVWGHPCAVVPHGHSCNLHVALLPFCPMCIHATHATTGY